MKFPKPGVLVARLHDDDDSCAVDIGLAFIRSKNGYNCFELHRDGEANFFDCSYDTIYTENITPLREFERNFSGDWKVLWKRT